MNPQPRAEPVDLATESVAGEEDPGASIDLAPTPSGAPGAGPWPPVQPGVPAPEGAAGPGSNAGPPAPGKAQPVKPL